MRILFSSIEVFWSSRLVGFLAACGVGGRILEVAGAETEAEAADVSEDTAQKVAMFCVSSVGCELLSEH